MSGSLLVSYGVSIDGYIADRDGDFSWGVPDAEQFAFHLAQVRGLGGLLLGRRLFETMAIWETDPSFASTDDERAFAEVWAALPKVVFSRTLERVEGNARLAAGTLEDELAALRREVEGGIEVGGAELAAQAFELDLVDELHLLRSPVLLGGGTPLLPALAAPLAFELVGVRTFASRNVHEAYRRVR